MARLARVVVPGLPYHVTHRGNRQEDVFFSPEDRQRYSRWLTHYCGVYGLEIWAYCLMTNHIHLLVVGRRADSMAKAIGRTHMRYSRWINERRGWTGHLWANRFASTPLDEGHLWTAAKYVELNPVRAGLAKRAEEYVWSSARAHARGLHDGLLATGRPFPGAVSRWSNWLNEGLDCQEADELRRNTYSGRPSGSKQFIKELEQRLGRTLQPGKRGRKPKEERNK